MRLLSFLSAIERALAAASPVSTASSWETQRMVNFHHGLARLSLRPKSGAGAVAAGGTIFVQAFALANGAHCLKTSLNWKGSEALPVTAVYPTASTNWTLESSRIASAWLEGPPATATITEVHEHEEQEQLAPLAAAFG